MQRIYEMCIGPCGICGRQHDNVGFAPNPRAPILWNCEDCTPYVRKVYSMPDALFTTYEERALGLAGERAGGYLDSIDKTDLAELSAEEWQAFLRHVTVGFAENIRGVIEVNDTGAPY